MSLLSSPHEALTLWHAHNLFRHPVGLLLVFIYRLTNGEFSVNRHWRSTAYRHSAEVVAMARQKNQSESDQFISLKRCGWCSKLSHMYHILGQAAEDVPLWSGPANGSNLPTRHIQVPHRYLSL